MAYLAVAPSMQIQSGFRPNLAAAGNINGCTSVQNHERASGIDDSPPSLVITNFNVDVQSANQALGGLNLDLPDTGGHLCIYGVVSEKAS